MGKAKKQQASRGPGRPKSVHPKAKRYMVRIEADKLVQFEDHARGLGFASAGAWLVRLGEKALVEPRV